MTYHAFWHQSANHDTLLWYKIIWIIRLPDIKSIIIFQAKILKCIIITSFQIIISKVTLSVSLHKMWSILNNKRMSIARQCNISVSFLTGYRSVNKKWKTFIESKKGNGPRIIPLCRDYHSFSKSSDKVFLPVALSTTIHK